MVDLYAQSQIFTSAAWIVCDKTMKLDADDIVRSARIKYANICALRGLQLYPRYH